MDKNYDIITFISKFLYLQKALSSQFAGIITIATMFIKTIFKDSKEIKMQSKSIFLDKKCWC